MQANDFTPEELQLLQTALKGTLKRLYLIREEMAVIDPHFHQQREAKSNASINLCYQYEDVLEKINTSILKTPS